MRLIDADELKKAIHCYENRRLPLDTVIDNAPTVDFSIISLKGLTAEEKHYLFKVLNNSSLKVISERPQGEWVYEEGWNAYCSNCSVPTKCETNFCPYCGADMRGKDND